MSVFSAYMSVHVICTYCPWYSEKVVRYPGTEFTGNCETPCGYWRLNLGLLQEQQRYFTAVSIHSFHLTFSDSVSHWSWNLPIQWPNANKKQSESRWVYFRLKGQEDSVYDGREDMTAEVWGGLSQCIFNQEAKPNIKL